MTMFDKKRVAALRDDMKTALAEVGSKHGVEFAFGNINASLLDFTTKLTCKVAGEDAERAEFERFAAVYGFRHSDFKRKVRINNEDFEFIGFNPSKPKNDCNIKSLLTGEVYMLNSTRLKNYLSD